MNEYNIKIGDYVETVDGGIGYVTSIKEKKFDWVITKKCNCKDAADVGAVTFGYFSEITEYYKRVGVNEFTKEKKFEPIEHYRCLKDHEEYKINELIDRINAIQERLNKYDNSRTD